MIFMVMTTPADSVLMFTTVMIAIIMTTRMLRRMRGQRDGVDGDANAAVGGDYGDTTTITMMKTLAMTSIVMMRQQTIMMN